MIARTTELLGEVVSWDTKSSDVLFSDIQQALIDAGLPDVARELNNRSAFMRAIAALKKDRSIDKVKEGKDGKVTFQITKKINNGELIDFDYEAIVELDCLTGGISCAESSAIEAEAIARFDHANRHRSASDITRLVQKLFKDHADLFPINPAKGVAYFVPDKHKDFTSKVEHFLSIVGGSVWRFPVPSGTAEGNKSVQEAVSSGLRAILTELNECVGEWNDSTRPDTMKRGIEKWKILKHKAESYAEYLQSEQISVLAEIEEAKKKLAEKIASCKPEEEPAAA